MEGAGGIALRIALAVCVMAGVWGTGAQGSAQSPADDAAAREHFERGRALFSQTHYEAALVHFREAYRLSRRGQLQYNIGISAERLRRDDEALQAFENYLTETSNPSREAEVRKRIAALEQAVAARKERERALASAATVSSRNRATDDGSGRKVPKSAIIGGSILAAFGTAGVVTMGVGLSRNGECLERDTSSACTAERTPSPWTGVYGALGIAALAGSATWFIVSSKRAKKKKRDTAWRLTPTGVVVSGSF